jgi:hypothetical protein
MRIFQVLNATAHGSLPENRTWYRNLFEPLIDLGHDVVFFSAEKGQLAMTHNNSQVRAEFSQNLLDVYNHENRKKPFDLFFSYLKDGMVDGLVIDEISRTGVPTCNFSCNNTHQFHLVEEISPHFDFCLHAERDARGKFISIGANPVWWPMASNPKYFKPRDIARIYDVSFVGGNYGMRAHYINHLLENGVDVHAFGPLWHKISKTKLRETLKGMYLGFKSLIALSSTRRTQLSAILAEFEFRRNLINKFPSNLHAPVSDDELIALYSKSHLSLGFLEVYDQHDPSKQIKKHLHLREFEAPMSGALYCTGYMDEIEEFYELGKEIVVYRNQHELLDKIRYFLQHPQEAENIRKAGRERALRDHTYHHRYQTLFKLIGLEDR